MNEHYITNSAYKQKIQGLTEKIANLAQRKTTAWINTMEHYEQYAQGEISKEEFRTVQDIANQAKEALIQATEGNQPMKSNTTGSVSFFLLAVWIFRSAKLWTVLIRL